MKTRDYIIHELKKRGHSVSRSNLSRWISGERKLNDYAVSEALQEITTARGERGQAMIRIPVSVWMQKDLKNIRIESLKLFSARKGFVYEGRGRNKLKG
jgi:hypothetical protein